MPQPYSCSYPYIIKISKASFDILIFDCHKINPIDHYGKTPFGRINQSSRPLNCSFHGDFACAMVSFLFIYLIANLKYTNLEHHFRHQNHFYVIFAVLFFPSLFLSLFDSLRFFLLTR